MSEPALSVLMPCFNTPGRFLREAVASVRDQTADVELLLQDGGSTRPDTLEVLQDLSGLAGVHVERRSDSGQADALNRALARARGAQVCWLNSDDLLVAGSVNALVATIQSDPELDGAFGDMRVIDREGKILRRYRSSEWSQDRFFRRGTYVFSGSLVLRTSVLRQIGGFEDGLHFVMDLEMYLRLGGSARMRHVPGEVACFRVHGESKTGSQGMAFAREELGVRVRYARTHRMRYYALAGYLRTVSAVATQPMRLSRTYGLLRGTKTL